MKLTFDATLSLTDHPLKLINEAYSFAELRKVFSEGDRITVMVQRRKKPRSLNSNALFHLWIGIIADDTGNSAEAVKSSLKLMFARKPLLDKEGNEQYDPKTGEVLEYIQDTASMNSQEFSEMMMQTKDFALTFFGILLPESNEQVALRFNN